MLCLYRWRTWDSDTTLLSSLMASSTINRLGLFFCFRIAVDKSSALELGEKTQLMSLSDTGPVQPPPDFISTSYKSLCCLVFHKLYLFVAQRRTLLPRDQLQGPVAGVEGMTFSVRKKNYELHLDTAMKLSMKRSGQWHVADCKMFCLNELVRLIWNHM